MHDPSNVIARIRQAVERSEELSQSALVAWAQVLTDLQRSQQVIARTKKRLAETEAIVIDRNQQE